MNNSSQILVFLHGKLWSLWVYRLKLFFFYVAKIITRLKHCHLGIENLDKLIFIMKN
jgi:hypothetical protein